MQSEPITTRSAPRNNRRILATTLVVAACVCPAYALDDESLARLVPADVGLFVEARDADDLLIPLTEEQVWITLAELAGQPARPEDAREWRRRIHDTIKMEPKIAIEVLFSQQVAFVGQGPGRSQDAVVLCRPTDAIPIDGLLRMWAAKPWPDVGASDVYRLRNNIGLAVRDRTLIFGDGLPREGMFRRVVKFNTPRSGAGLADDPTYQQLLARVPANPDGILFARMGRACTLPARSLGGRRERPVRVAPQRLLTPLHCRWRCAAGSQATYGQTDTADRNPAPANAHRVGQSYRLPRSHAGGRAVA